jgi:hypothetical protein
MTSKPSFKRWVGNLSIRQKLILITVTSSAMALLVACCSFAVYDYYDFRQTLVRELSASADVIGLNSVAALKFGDKETAQEALNSLRVHPSVLTAGIHDLRNVELAEYWHDQAQPEIAWEDDVPLGTWLIKDGILVVARPILYENKFIGGIRLCSTLQPLYERLYTYLVLLCGVLSAGMAVTLIAVRRFQRVVTAPILDVTHTARSITESKNYAARAKRAARTNSAPW